MHSLCFPQKLFLPSLQSIKKKIAHTHFHLVKDITEQVEHDSYTQNITKILIRGRWRIQVASAET